MTTKEQFLTAHNKLAPVNLKATLNILTVFKSERPKLFPANDWPVEKIRRPFIMWLTSISRAQKEEISNIKK